MFKTFKKFKVMVKKETGKHIKVVWSNKGDEFTLTAFVKYCEEHDIRLFTTTYSPQQNGVIERKNWTVLDIVRKILKSKNTPRNLGQKWHNVPFMCKIGIHMQS